jgi:hypothetical protein
VNITNMLFKVEPNVKTPSGHKKPGGESNMNTLSECKSGGEKSAVAEVDCKIIESLLGFGLFDLGINSA